MRAGARGGPSCAPSCSGDAAVPICAPRPSVASGASCNTVTVLCVVLPSRVEAPRIECRASRALWAGATLCVAEWLSLSLPSLSLLSGVWPGRVCRDAAICISAQVAYLHVLGSLPRWTRNQRKLEVQNCVSNPVKALRRGARAAGSPIASLMLLGGGGWPMQYTFFSRFYLPFSLLPFFFFHYL